MLWSHPPHRAPCIHTCLFPYIHSRAASVPAQTQSGHITPLLKHSGLTSILEQRPNHNRVFRTWYQLLPDSPPSFSTSYSCNWASISSTSIPRGCFATMEDTGCSSVRNSWYRLFPLPGTLSPLHPFACLSHTTDLSLKICSSMNFLPHTSLPLPAPSTFPSRTYCDMQLCSYMPKYL